MQTECSADLFGFAPVEGRAVVAGFDGGKMTSDAGAMLLGADKRAAAEFSFFLAMPTMAGAFAYDLLKNYKILSANDVAAISVGFVAAFFSALLVVRALLNYVSRHGYGPFAWWRIVVGAAGLAGLIVYG